MQVDIPDTVIHVTIGAIVVFIVTIWVLRKLTLGKYGTRHVIITGCDTGFGNLATQKFDHLGFHVFAGCLTEDGVNYLTSRCSDRLQAFRLDVTNVESIKRGLAFVKSRLPDGKGLWGIVNNAGIGGAFVFFEIQRIEQFKEVLAVNLYGVINVTKAFLPLIRQRRGRIVNVASIAGRFAWPFMTPYVISKFGVEAFSDSLRRELYKTGVTVHIIEPGFFLTNILNVDNVNDVSRKAIAEADKEVRAYYGEKESEQVLKLFETTLKKTGSRNVGKVPDAIIHALTARYPKSRYLVGWDANVVIRLLWTLPEFISDYLLCRDYPTPAGARGDQ